MFSAYLKSAVAGAFLLGFATTAFAATGEFNNMCTMGLATGQDIKTDCSINAQLEGKTYCFGRQGRHGRVHEKPKGKSRQGADLLLKEASRLSSDPTRRPEGVGFGQAPFLLELPILVGLAHKYAPIPHAPHYKQSFRGARDRGSPDPESTLPGAFLLAWRLFVASTTPLWAHSLRGSRSSYLQPRSPPGFA